MKISKRLPLLRRKTASRGAAKSGTKASAGSKSSSIYRSCKELPLDRFIEISETQNFSLLDRNYDPHNDQTESKIPVAELLATWEDISLEYSELIGPDTLISALEKRVKYDWYTHNFTLVTFAVQILSHVYDEELVQILKEMRVGDGIDNSDPVRYAKSLERVITRAKSQYLIPSKVLLGEIESLSKSVEHTEQPKDFWLSVKIALENEAGFHLDWSKKTVAEYAERYKALLRKIESLQQIKAPNNVR